MSDETQNEDPRQPSELPESVAAEEDEAPDSAQLRGLLQSAMAASDAPPPDVLTGVQRKLRDRSQGKFYADAWSTTREPPVARYLITSLLMLAVIAVIWLALAPLSGLPEVVESTPPPVQVLPPPRR